MKKEEVELENGTYKTHISPLIHPKRWSNIQQDTLLHQIPMIK